MAPPAPATATLTGPTGTVMGIATLTQTRGGIRLVVNGMGLTPGAHGVTSTPSAAARRPTSPAPGRTGTRPT